MKFVAIVFSMALTLAVHASPTEDLLPLMPDNYTACKSAEEFQKSVEYFREEKNLSLNDKQIVTWSIKIARGCTGSLSRFKKVFELLIKSGVDLKKSVEMASDFSKRTDDQTDSFVGLFKTFFLENYFNLDFMTAFKLSNMLSEKPSQAPFARKDFERLYKFCTDQDKLGLPFKQCAQYSMNLLEHYDLYPEGIYPFFEKIYLFLSTQAGATLSIAESLQMSSDVLTYGPLAPDNFKKAYLYSISKQGLSTSLKQGMRIALEVTKSSIKEKPQ